MNDSTSRRSFLASSIGGATAFQIIRPALVRGQGAPVLKAGLIGCGGRGTQAMENILTGCDNVEIVAMADVFEDRMETSLRMTQALKPELSKRFKVDPEHRFVGFDAYKKLVASEDGEHPNRCRHGRASALPRSSVRPASSRNPDPPASMPKSCHP